MLKQIRPAIDAIAGDLFWRQVPGRPEQDAGPRRQPPARMFVRGELGDHFLVDLGIDARVVHKDVNRTEAANCFGRHPLDVGFVGNVEVDADVRQAQQFER